MAQTQSITEADIRALASGQSFDRGYRYYRNSSVFDITLRGNLITANVEGNAYEPYRVQVTVTDSGINDTFCTCPYDWGGICKHIAATLLTIINQPESIVEKLALTTLLADLTADQLRQVLINVAETGPEYAETIDQEVAWLRDQPVSLEASTGTDMVVDTNATCREIQKDFRLAGKGDPFQHGYYDEYAGMEVYPEEILQPHLDKIEPLLDGGNVQTAVTLITAIIQTYKDGLADLDEWVYEYNEDMFYEANLTLGAVLAEVLLSLDLRPDQQEEWLNQISGWQDELSNLEIAATAVEQGWSHPPLAAAMQGNITEKGAWEGESPYYADELARARLRILARQERTQEYINLAEAEGQTVLAINMLAQSGDIDKAVAEAKAYLVYPREILSLAHILAAKEAIEAALDVAEHGLGLDDEHGKVELAQWTRDQAIAAGHDDLALKAAQTAFFTSYQLADYTAVRQLAGTQWPILKPELLQKLGQSGAVSNKIDIYLHEHMLVEAMQALDGPGFTTDYDLLRVIEATREITPDWGIRKYKQKAEEIMNAGNSGSYDTAVSWLRSARDIYLQHHRQREWQAYLDSLLETHHRKYKLVPMLRDIRD